jgi:hypothetical protein
MAGHDPLPDPLGLFWTHAPGNGQAGRLCAAGWQHRSTVRLLPESTEHGTGVIDARSTSLVPPITAGIAAVPKCQIRVRSTPDSRHDSDDRSSYALCHGTNPLPRESAARKVVLEEGLSLLR